MKVTPVARFYTIHIHNLICSHDLLFSALQIYNYGELTSVCANIVTLRVLPQSLLLAYTHHFADIAVATENRYRGALKLYSL